MCTLLGMLSNLVLVLRFFLHFHAIITRFGFFPETRSPCHDPERSYSLAQPFPRGPIRKSPCRRMHQALVPFIFVSRIQKSWLPRRMQFALNLSHGPFCGPVSLLTDLAFDIARVHLALRTQVERLLWTFLELFDLYSSSSMFLCR